MSSNIEQQQQAIYDPTRLDWDIHCNQLYAIHLSSILHILASDDRHFRGAELLFEETHDEKDGYEHVYFWWQRCLS